MRAVDADSLKKKIEGLRCSVIGLRVGKGLFTEFLRQYITAILEIVDEEPTVDPVKHGKWVAQDAGYTRFMCSACGSKNYWGYEKYCPNCGAKMGDE